MAVAVKDVVVEEDILVVVREPVEATLLGLARKVDEDHLGRILFESVETQDCVPLTLSPFDDVVTNDPMMFHASPDPQRTSSPMSHQDGALLLAVARRSIKVEALATLLGLGPSIPFTSTTLLQETVVVISGRGGVMQFHTMTTFFGALSGGAHTNIGLLWERDQIENCLSRPDKLDEEGQGCGMKIAGQRTLSLGLNDLHDERSDAVPEKRLLTILELLKKL